MNHYNYKIVHLSLKPQSITNQQNMFMWETDKNKYREFDKPENKDNLWIK